jgi:hypothetical protein
MYSAAGPATESQHKSRNQMANSTSRSFLTGDVMELAHIPFPSDDSNGQRRIQARWYNYFGFVAEFTCGFTAGFAAAGWPGFCAQTLHQPCDETDLPG